MQAHESILKRVTCRPDVFAGKPIIRDLRISVETILGLLSEGVSWDEMLDDYPALEREDIRACLVFARALLSNESIELVQVL